MSTFKEIKNEILELEKFQEHRNWKQLNLDEQIVILKTFLDKNINDERAWKLLGLAYFYMNNKDYLNDAILCLKKYLSFHSAPNNWAIYEVIGGCYALKGDFQFNIPCSNMDNWFLRSGRLNNPEQYAGNPNKVIGYVSQIRDTAQGNRFNNFFTGYFDKTKLHCKLPYTEISIDDRMKAYKLYEDADNKYNNNEIKEAIGLLDKAIQINPNSELFYELQGLCYSSTNPPKFDIAVNNYMKAIEIDPVESNFIMGMMRPLIELGKKDEALKYIQIAEKLGNKYAHATKQEIILMQEKKENTAKDNNQKDEVAKKPWWKF